MDEREYAPLDRAGSSGRLAKDDADESPALEMVFTCPWSDLASVSIGVQCLSHTAPLTVCHTTVCYFRGAPLFI